MIVIGLMSGTSCDAIEGAAAEFLSDGTNLVLRPIGSLTHNYPEGLHRDLLNAQLPDPMDTATVCRLDTLVGRELAVAAQQVQEEFCEAPADLIASHGHTLWHWIEAGRVAGTLQIGQPAWIAEQTGVPVVADLRARDVAAGGQGAPLLSKFDVLALNGISNGSWAGPGRARPSAALNLGGIANITVVGPGVTLAYDTGPANALLDGAAAHFTGGREHMDRDGERAARGSVDQALLADLLAHPYYAAPPPKSTGKEVFNATYLLDRLTAHDVAPDDVFATLTALTAKTVGRELVRHDVGTVVVSGGGTNNPSLMGALADWAPGVTIQTSDVWGIPPLAKEAYGFALLGWFTYNGLAGNEPECTGARAHALLGTISPGRGPLRLPPPLTTSPTRLTVVESAPR